MWSWSVRLDINFGRLCSGLNWSLIFDHSRVIAMGMWTSSLTDEVKGGSVSLPGKHVLEMEGCFGDYICWWKCEVMAEGPALYITTINVCLTKEPVLCSLLWKVFPWIQMPCVRSAPDLGQSMIQTFTAQHLCIEMLPPFRQREQREWGNHALSVACLLRCHLGLQIPGLLKSQQPARACFWEHPSLIPVQEAESFL